MSLEPVPMMSPSTEGQTEFNPIDRHFARFIGKLSAPAGAADPDIELAAGLVSYARSLGHICLDLHAIDSVDSDSARLAIPVESLPNRKTWIEKLKASLAVGGPGQFKPLILDEAGRLYLHRYWQYETDLAASLKSRASASPGDIDLNVLRKSLVRLFPRAPAGEVDWQMVAAFAALRRGLCVISGGPGTGKTRTVVVLLALMLEQQPDLRIALAAPTGKATARLQESIRQTKHSLACPTDIKAKLPEDATTIHRLLGAIQDSAYFRHDAKHPMPLDVVVVDEASMVDLALIAKLLWAMSPSARLILLGDKDQLASVEAGSVLADICGGKAERGFSTGFCSEFEQLTGMVLSAAPAPRRDVLGDCIVELRRNYRFGNHSAIYQLSEAVNAADSDRALEVLRKAAVGSANDLSSRPLPSPGSLKEQLTPLVLEHFKPLVTADDPAVALRLLARFRILSPVRRGPYGVENLNLVVEAILRDAGLVAGRGAFYRGRPVMITRNDYALKLFNGDIGLILPDPATRQLRAWFPASEGDAPRSFFPLRLPEQETAFALTVHKSQGSEFERVLLILPSEDSRVLTRELVYTGLTRASNRVEVWFDERLLRTAIGRRTLRRSGLRDALWGRTAD